MLLHDPSALQSIRTPLFASPSASCYPERERWQETAETWDFQTFSDSDAVGEGEESVPTPSQAETNRQSLAWPRADTSPENHQCLCNPKGFGALLGHLPQNPSKSLPGGSITHSLVLVRCHDGGWKFSSWQPGMCKMLGVSPHCAVPSPNGKFSSPRICSERETPQ